MPNTLRYLIRSGDGATLCASAPDLIHHAISLGYRYCDAEDWRAERLHRPAAEDRP